MIQKINTLLARSIVSLNAVLAIALVIVGSIVGIAAGMAFLGSLALIVGPVIGIAAAIAVCGVLAVLLTFEAFWSRSGTHFATAAAIKGCGSASFSRSGALRKRILDDAQRPIPNPLCRPFSPTQSVYGARIFGNSGKSPHIGSCGRFHRSPPSESSARGRPRAFEGVGFSADYSEASECGPAARGSH